MPLPRRVSRERLHVRSCLLDARRGERSPCPRLRRISCVSATQLLRAARLLAAARAADEDHRVWRRRILTPKNLRASREDVSRSERNRPPRRPRGPPPRGRAAQRSQPLNGFWKELILRVAPSEPRRVAPLPPRRASRAELDGRPRLYGARRGERSLLDVRQGDRLSRCAPRLP